jgi:acetyl-CoA carboxylase biotin carboxylase subunit
VKFTGHAIECRINAESPGDGFRPCPGSIDQWSPPKGVGIRVDSHCFPGYSVPPFYDSLLAKLILHGEDRPKTIQRMRQALETFKVKGIDTTLPFLNFLLSQQSYAAGDVNTRWLEERLEQFSL